MQNIKVVLAGAPRSGKSCLREGVKEAVRRIPGAPYCYVITANPDGEGAWFQATVNRNALNATQLKVAYKKALGGFSPDFVRTRAEWVRNCTAPLTIVDIGGIPSAENEIICAGATHIVILTRDLSLVEEWRAFAAHLGLGVIAVIHSTWSGAVDVVKGFGPDGVLRGSVHYLERGVDVSSRPMVESLAKLLVQMVTAEE